MRDAAIGLTAAKSPKCLMPQDAQATANVTKLTLEVVKKA
jgi:hypothetical protein